MGLFSSIGRAGVRLIDKIERRALRVYEFTDSEQCIFRIAREHSPRHVELSDGTVVNEGDLICEFHLWSEHVPRMGPGAPGLEWALEIRRGFVRSTEMLARYLVDAPEFEGFVAVLGRGLMLESTIKPLGRLLSHLGFEEFVLPLSATWQERFGMWWKRLYASWLIRTFQPETMRGHSMNDLVPFELWLSRAAMMANAGPGVPEINL